MTCKQARQLLAAYRRDDSSLSEHAGLQAHLVGCAECRARAAEFRRVGEALQRLPSIEPPPDFFARVMAAARADEHKAAEQARTVEKKRVTVVVPGLTDARHFPTLRRAVKERRVRLAPLRPPATPAATFALRYSAALAAVFLLFSFGLSFVLFQLLNGNGSPKTLPSGLGTSQVLTSVYAPDPAYPLVADATASADGQYIIYAAHNASGKWMLEELNRLNGQSTALLPAPVATPLSLEGWARSWVLWIQGSAGTSSNWQLNATELLPALPGAGPTLLLLRGGQDGPDGKVAALHGVYASGLTVLLAEELADGRGQLVSLDLAYGTALARSVLRKADPGHLILNPTSDGTTDYWVDSWLDVDGTVYGNIWRLLSGGSPEPVTTNDSSFAPMIVAGKLVWLEEPLPPNGESVNGASSSTPTPTPVSTLTPGGGSASDAPVTGILWSEDQDGRPDLDTSPRVSISGNQLVSQPQAGATFIVWQNRGGDFYLCDLVNSQHSQSINQLVSNALVLTVSPTAVLWVTTDSQNSSQTPTRTTINLLEWPQPPR